MSSFKACVPNTIGTYTPRTINRYSLLLDV